MQLTRDLFAIAKFLLANKSAAVHETIVSLRVSHGISATAELLV